VKYLAPVTFRNLIVKYCDELKDKSIKFANSKEFKTSEYHDYTAVDLVEAIHNEDHEDRRAVLVCMLHYKLEHFMYQTTAERRHFERFKGDLTK
jgi:hypothetical protein